MKELSIEEKAKRYDEAIEQLRAMMPNWENLSYNGKTFLQDLVYIIPELKESEDEKIKQFLIREIEGTSDEIMSYRNMNKKDVLTWLEKQGEHANFRNKIQVGDKVTRNRDGVLVNLSQLNRVAKKDEKQGEQKPTDNIEPKFKVGDFIVNDYCIGKVIELTNDAYLLDTGQGVPFSCEHNAHLWTIQDAKDGDVLATLDYILIFKEFLKNDGGISYCHYDFGAGNPQFIWSEDKNWYFGKEAIVYPATKEQRDLLFQKMKEAGYEWDAEKKEVKKIEENFFWSEDDENIRQWIISDINKLHYLKKKSSIIANKEINWLKSLKDRVQPKQEWSEEDEEMYKEVLTNIIYAKNDLKVKECLGLSKRAMKAFNWFSKRYKSLKPQNTWRPSDAQMASITCVVRNMKESACYDSELVSLLNDLKKLKG